MKLPKLYTRTVSKAIQQWEIIIEGDQYYTIAGQLNGALTKSAPHTAKGKNIGRANETTPEQQSILEAKSKWDKKKKEGYFESVNDIDSKIFVEPMLAQKFMDRREKIKYPVAVEDKYNGIRMVRHEEGGFSRTGEQFFCVDHILESTSGLIKKYPNLVLDGELFSMKYRNLLNRITSLVSVNRKEKDVSADDLAESRRIVEYWVYDAYGYEGITEETPYIQRKDALEELIAGRDFLVYADYRLARDEEAVMNALSNAVSRKMEGVMIKDLNGTYEHKRSKYLLKLKKFEDAEYEVLDIEGGTGNWEGKAKRIICKLPNGETFASNIRGTYEELEDLLRNKQKHIGKKATVTYQELSEYGVPLIPYTSLPFRDYE